VLFRSASTSSLTGIEIWQVEEVDGIWCKEEGKKYRSRRWRRRGSEGGRKGESRRNQPLGAYETRVPRGLGCRNQKGRLYMVRVPSRELKAY
jgi:hypothetical protein